MTKLQTLTLRRYGNSRFFEHLAYTICFKLEMQEIMDSISSEEFRGAYLKVAF